MRVSGLLIIILSVLAVPSAGRTKDDSLSLRQIHLNASSIPSVQSMLIQQGGRLLTEQYFNGFDGEEPVNIKSASKSIMSLLIGIAIEKGFIKSVEQPIRPFFKEYFEKNPHQVKENITLKDLLTMQAGLETTSEENYARWVTSDDWVSYILNQPMQAKPGGEMIYSSGSSHLLSVILNRATGMTVRDFANRYLFEPMDIRLHHWQRGPRGYYFGGNNMFLLPRDMLKIGQMVLNGGLWEGQRIVSKEWLNNSFQTYTRSKFNPYDYGFMWWKKKVAGHEVRFAWGWGGQYIFMIPDLNAVIVLTGSLQLADWSREYKEPVFTLLRESIIPFLEKRNAL